jgi:Tfp pilus assembly PilM family ATPase
MLHLVQLERGAEGLHIRATCSVPSPVQGDDPPPAAAKELKAALRRAFKIQPFRGRRIVTTMPDAGVKLMVVNYEADTERSEPQQILSLVEERIDDAIDQCVVDYVPIRTSGEKRGARSALLAVARRDAVIRHLEFLRAAGLEVEALEIAPVAVRRLVAWLARDDVSRKSLVLHCGAQRSHLVVLDGRRLILYREIDFGEDQAIESLSKSLDMDRESAASVLYRYGVHPDDGGREAWEDPAAAFEISETVMEILKPGVRSLADQIEKASIYTASEWRGACVDQVHLLGRFDRWPGIDRLLGGVVSIPVGLLDPLAAPSFGGFSPPDDAAARDGGIALATGMALRGICDDG